MNVLEGILYMIWRGLAIGVIISAPMGPVGILCVQRTLQKGRRTGFFTGVGAAISDLFYCLLTGFGLSLIEDFLKANQDIIQIVGSVVMAVFGLYLFRSNPSRQLKTPEAVREAGKRDVIQGFLFTFSNPLIIFLIIGLFARFNFLLPEISFVQCAVGYIFIIAGALGWWWMVSYFVDKVRNHFNLRSMWLINKITGSIIMIFALVGVITAVSSMAGAASRPPVHLNSVRGFGSWGTRADSPGDSPLHIANMSDSPKIYALPLDGAERFSFLLRAFVRKGEWGIVAFGGGDTLTFFPSVTSNFDDPNYPAEMRVRTVRGGADVGLRTLRSGFADADWNSWRLSMADGVAALAVGNRAYGPAAECSVGAMPDSVGIMIAPGGELLVDWLTLEATAPERGDISTSYDFGDPDVRHTYFARSSDPMEGEWEIFDRSFSDDRLRLGGDYRLALAKVGADYRIIYLSGAEKNPEGWRSGDVKGNLRATAHAGVYDVQWFDPVRREIAGEAKAQFAAPDLLIIQFADHDSSMRLRKASF